MKPTNINRRAFIRGTSTAALGMAAIPLSSHAEGEDGAGNSSTILISNSASVQERFAAREIRRYVYLRTGMLLNIRQVNQVIANERGIVIGVAGNEWLKPLSASLPGQLGGQDYSLKSLILDKKELLVIVGGSPTACLYGAYEFLESLGIRFYLHGDTIPDGMTELRLDGFDSMRHPLFEVRGIQPFHDFAVGPDWWDEDDYKLHIAQLAKMRMNFIGLHTYPEGKPYAEPTVWIGLPEDVAANGTVKASYPSYYQNTASGAWAHASKKTSQFCLGASQLFERDDYGSEVMNGLCPQPQTPEQCNELFNRTGRMFSGAFSLAKLVGVKTAVGTEAPLTIPKDLKNRLSQNHSEAGKGGPECVLVGPASSTAETAVSIPSADEPAVYQSVRYGMEKYLFNLPNGKYDVELRFVEHWKDAAEKRVFTVALQSRVVVEHFDVFKQVGKGQPLNCNFNEVLVENGKLTIGFTPEIESPAIAGIVIRGKDYLKKINCGGPAFKDWQVDPSQQTSETIFKPSDDEVLRIYEGIFRRVMKTHSLDYFWLWTAETEGVNYPALLTELKIARQALRNVGDPFRLAISGWGNVGEQFHHLDRDLPKDIIFSSLGPDGGRDPIDPAYKDLDRPKWAIPWLENDGEFLGSVLKVGWMRADAKLARDYNCTGLIGLQWRTQPVTLQASALAKAGWSQQNWRDFRSPLPIPLADGEGAVGGTNSQYLRHTRFHEPEENLPQLLISTIYGSKGEDPIYRYGRQGMSAYQFNVPNGSYRVTLKFCDWGASKPGQRVFDIKIQGQLVESKLDIPARSGGMAHVLVTDYADVKVADGRMVIDFIANPNAPIINGIVIEQTDGSYVRKVNCGGPAFGDYAGEQYRRDLTGDFYLDWARTEFGEAIAPEAASILEKWDSWLPWVSEWGPGAAQPDTRPLADALKEIAFIDEFVALGERIKEPGAKARFAYWAHLLRYQQAVTRFNCTWGNKLSNDELIAALREVYRHLFPMIGSKGALGQIAHWEQLVLGTEITSIAGNTSLKPPMEYQGEALLLNPCPRTTLMEGESLRIKGIFLDAKPPNQFKLSWKALGEKSFQTRPMEHLARGVYQVILDKRDLGQGEIEYYLHAETAAGQTLIWPATAPQRNHTVISIA
jgi:hypothetical protein